jgi:hypothetical protein
MLFAKYKYLQLNVLKEGNTTNLNLSIHIKVELCFNLNDNHDPRIGMACLEVISNDSLYKLMAWEIHSTCVEEGLIGI